MLILVTINKFLKTYSLKKKGFKSNDKHLLKKRTLILMFEKTFKRLSLILNFLNFLTLKKCFFKFKLSSFKAFFWFLNL